MVGVYLNPVYLNPVMELSSSEEVGQIPNNGVK